MGFAVGRNKYVGVWMQRWHAWYYKDYIRVCVLCGLGVGEVSDVSARVVWV